MTQAKSKPSKPSPQDALPWDVLVGRNVKACRERAGFSQEEVARRAREWGLDWTRVTVAAIERGKRSFDLREAVALVPAIGIALSDLFVGTEWIDYGPRGQVRAPAVAAMVSGRYQQVKPLSDFIAPAPAAEEQASLERMDAIADGIEYREVWWPDASDTQLTHAVSAARGEPEVKAAKALDLDPVVLSILAFRRWGRSLSEQRDRKLAEEGGAGADPRRLQALRGHITRRLIGELREALDEWPWEQVKAGVEVAPWVETLHKERRALEAAAQAQEPTERSQPKPGTKKPTTKRRKS